MSPCLAKGRLILDVPQHRQHKCKRLPTARLSHPDAVAPAHDDRECLGLQGSGGVTCTACMARLEQDE